MYDALTTADAITIADHAYRRGHWATGYAVIGALLATTPAEKDEAALRLARVRGWSTETWKRGREASRDPHSELDRVEDLAGDDGLLLAGAHYERGMTLHQEFIMATGDEDRELSSFARAAELYDAAGDVEGAAMATAMTGIFHHVDRLDRDAARPLLERAYAMAPDDGSSYARSEAARHLGQISQELGDPRGALPMLEESLALRISSGWEIFVASGHHALASALLDAGDLEGAERHLVAARATASSFPSEFTLALVARTEADLTMARLAPGVWQRAHP